MLPGNTIRHDSIYSESERARLGYTDGWFTAKKTDDQRDHQRRNIDLESRQHGVLYRWMVRWQRLRSGEVRFLLLIFSFSKFDGMIITSINLSQLITVSIIRQKEHFWRILTTSLVTSTSFFYTEHRSGMLSWLDIAVSRRSWDLPKDASWSLVQNELNTTAQSRVEQHCAHP